jgi:hypothetical protein
VVGAVFAEVGQVLVQAIKERGVGETDRHGQLVVEFRHRAIRREDVDKVPRADAVRRANAGWEDEGAFAASQRGQRFGEGAANPLAHLALAFCIGCAEVGGDGTEEVDGETGGRFGLTMGRERGRRRLDAGAQRCRAEAEGDRRLPTKEGVNKQHGAGDKSAPAEGGQESASGTACPPQRGRSR